MGALLPQQFAKVLYGITEGKSGKELDDAIHVFARYLAKQRSVKKLPYILNEFTRLVERIEGRDPIHITSARELTADTITRIQEVFGRQRDVSTSIDESMIGGTKITMANTILDGSIKTQLEKLKQSLM